MNFTNLESRPMFRAAVWKRNLHIALLVVLELLVLYFLSTLRITTEGEGIEFLGYVFSFHPFSWKTLFWIAVFIGFQVWGAESAFLASLKDKDTLELYPEDKSENRIFGELKGKDIVRIVQETAKEFGVRKVDKVIVTDKPDPNAFTAHLFGWWNCVVLHSNLLEVLPRERVRSVIAHEVAHIRRWDSMVYQIARLPASFAWLIAALAFLHMGWGLIDEDTTFWLTVQRVLAIVLAMGVTAWAFQLFTRVANLASQQSEFIADAYAAEACGWEAHLNALLLIGERAEALTVLLEAVKDLPVRVEQVMTEEQMLRLLGRFPRRELDEHVAKEVGPRLFIEDRLEQLREGLCLPLTNEQIRDLAERGGEALKKKLAAESKEDGAKAKEDASRLMEWRNFDLDASGHLDPQETRALMEELKAHPEKMIFRQFLNEGVEWASHPSIRDRILFLYEMFAG